MKIQTVNGISYITFSNFSPFPVTAAVSTRQGGVSQGAFSSLDMGFHNGDVPENVKENRKRFGRALGIPAEHFISCQQVHGTHIEIVTSAQCGRGAFSYESAFPGTDGLMTNEKNVPVTMNFADCTPLLFYDPVKQVIALSHGGWRGAAGNIAGHTVSLMSKTFGSRPEDILAGIGPAIGYDSFEVGEEVIDAFAPLIPAEAWKKLHYKKENGKYMMDLPGTNRELMILAGILPEHIEDCGIDTFTHTDLFYSYRKDHGHTGRHMALMMLGE